MSETIEVTRVIPAKPERIFNAWLSGDEHGLMIGSTATYDASTGEFTAWDGYISGRTTDQQPTSRIVQAWRTTEFPEGAADSRLEVRLEEVEGGTQVTLLQTDIPDGQGESYEVGWSDHYFDPMTDYFTSARSRLKDAGEAIEDAAEQAGEALEAVGAEVRKAAVQVQKSAKKAGAQVQKSAKKASATVKKSAKKASSQVKKLVQKAKKKLAAAKRKTARRPAKQAKARRPAPKKKAARSGKRRR